MTAEVMKTKEYFLKVVSNVLNGKAEICAPSASEFEGICRLAKRNAVEGILYQAFSSFKAELASDSFAHLEKAYKLSAIRQLAQEEEMKALRAIFNDSGIDFMFLKGAHLKALYPAPELRFMVDMDILLHSSNLTLGKEILLSRGFELDFDNGKDIVFVKKPFLTIELHRSLFQEDYFMYPYFEKCWDRAKILSAHEYKMTDEDLYVYTLAHLAEHYTQAGSCFRPVADLYLMEKKYPELDFPYIQTQFEEIGISEFADNIRRLAKCMFENEPKDKTLELMENFIVLGPPVQNASAASAIATSGKSKFSRIFSTLFPDFKHMSLKYPILKKLPFLLPILWLARIVQYTFTKDTVIVKKKQQLKNSDKKSVELLESIFRQSGL